MIKTKPFFITCCAILAIVICSVCVLFIINFYNANREVTKIPQSKDRQIKMNFSENLLSAKDLKAASDLIIRGTVTKLKEQSTKKVPTPDNNGGEFIVEVPVNIYELKVVENIKNNKELTDTINLVIPDSSIIEIDQDYVFLLYEIKGHSDLTGSYGLVSLSQGLYLIDKDTDNVVSVKDGAKAEYNQLKSTFIENSVN